MDGVDGREDGGGVVGLETSDDALAVRGELRFLGGSGSRSALSVGGRGWWGGGSLG